MSSTAALPCALQEDLPLEPLRQFVYSIDVADLGLDPELVEILVAAGPLCFLDFEATGLDTTGDDLIEAGAVWIEAGTSTAKVFNTLLHTQQELSPFIRRLTGISQDLVASAPSIEEVAPLLDDFIADAAVVAHNAAFERAWLRRCLGRRFDTHPFLDTVELLALVYPDTPNMKLDTFCRRSLQRSERHRALDDSLDTLRVVERILAQSRDGSPAAANALDALRHYAPNNPWRVRLEGLPAASTSTMGALAETITLDADGAEPVPFEADAIAARLGDKKTVRSVIPDFSNRSGQIELARRVHDCLAGSKGKSVGLTEAGTGIGKTLAYLAAAIPFAVNTGEQVIISTSSKMLQTQLLEKDIPAAAKILGYPDLRFTVMKGRANYICRRRLDTYLDERRGSGGSFAATMIAAFANSAGHGEVDRLPGVLYHLHPELERAVRDITSADATECSRQDCQTTKSHCVFREARHKLEGAQIAVVNHDLLLRWPPDYPPLRHLILDEVHELCEKADAAYARTASGIELAHRLSGLLGNTKGHTEVTAPHARELADRALGLVAAVGNEGRAVAKAGSSQGSFQFSRDELLVPVGGPGPEWNGVIHNALELAETLETLRTSMEDDEDETPSQSRAREVFGDAVEVLRGGFPFPKSDAFVYRLRGLSRPSTVSWRMIATPVLPADDFRIQILEQAESVFGTSATLAVGKDKAGALRELQLEENAAGRLALGDPIASPFDYASNLEVIFVSDPTQPGALVDNTARAIRCVAEQLGGRTLGLFTSRDRMLKVANLIEPGLADQGISIVAPSTGNADPHDLVRTFLDSPQSVLLGARSFWQGVDIAGDACQAVVIEKLPFDVPGDPLLERRADLLFGGSRRTFAEYSVPRMLLRLKQMMGRLVRTPTDRGVIIVVESRADKPYFKRLRDALPPNANTRLVPMSDLPKAVDEALARVKVPHSRPKD